MLDRIDLPDLTAFSQPEWNDACTLSEALCAILSANDEQSSLSAYHRLLYAVGNDHAGTHYSVALGILPIIERILQDGSPWSQHAALEVLIEWCGPFTPEPGQELYLGLPLQTLIKERICGLQQIAGTLANDEGVAVKSARQLLDCIHDPLD